MRITAWPMPHHWRSSLPGRASAPNSTVVFYGYAPALGFWLMKLYGHRNVHILNCSRDDWRSNGHPWSTKAIHPAGGRYPLADTEPGVRADRGAVQRAIGDPERTLVDVRSEAEFTGARFWPSGATEPNGRAGHIPTAVHQPIDDLYDEHGAFQPAERLRRVFSAVDLASSDDAHHVLCGRRTRGNRLVCPHAPAGTRACARLRRLVGRVGSAARHSCRTQLNQTAVQPPSTINICPVM